MKLFHFILKKIVFLFVNHILCGPRPWSFAIKRGLLRLLGYNIGKGSKIVGPINNTGTLVIGKHCWIGSNLCLRGNGTVTIGDNCDIAPDVTFITGGHQVGDETRRAGKGESYRIEVGHGVWIGARTTIGRDILIGDSSVIAACACVFSDVPRNVLVGGVPAKVIRRL